MIPSDDFNDRCRLAPCRGCDQRGLEPVLDLGMMPPSDRLLTRERAGEEVLISLEVGFCHRCTLLQVLETAPPELLFGDDYLYFSSVSESWLDHCRTNAIELIESRQLDSRSFVVEIASNDGYLLKNFVERDIPVLGIDPAPFQAKAAEEIGVHTLNRFFTQDLAESLRGEYPEADVILANNVIAHVSAIHDVLEGIHNLLKDEGILVIEAPYVRDLVDQCQFDTIYHEHLCYFSVTSMNHLMRRHGLFINFVKHLPTHGGSIRYYIEKVDAPAESVTTMLLDETERGMDAPDYYRQFAEQAGRISDELGLFVKDLHRQGNRVVAYGAAAKGTILLNASGLDHTVIDYAVDRNTHKQGRLIPGVGIEIFPVERILEDMPDFILLLPWNLADEILAQQDEFRRRGGRFIIPAPKLRVI